MHFQLIHMTHLSAPMLIELSARKHKAALGILSGVIFTSIFSLCRWVQACLDTHSSRWLSISHRESTRTCQKPTRWLEFLSALSRHNSKLHLHADPETAYTLRLPLIRHIFSREPELLLFFYYKGWCTLWTWWMFKCIFHYKWRQHPTPGLQFWKKQTFGHTPILAQMFNKINNKILNWQELDINTDPFLIPIVNG